MTPDTDTGGLGVSVTNEMSMTPNAVPTWHLVENGIVHRTDGNTRTLLSFPDFCLVSTNSKLKLIHIHNVPGVTDLAGITENNLSMFYVVAGN
jgi:hypothetical protein